MSTRIGYVPIPVLFPLRCPEEVAEGFLDILSLFKRVSKKAYPAMLGIENALMLLRNYGPLDVMDVDIKSPETRVKIKMLLR